MDQPTPQPGNQPHTPHSPDSAKVVDLLRSGGLIAYPTDSCFALGTSLDNREGLDRIRSIRKLDDKHHFTLVCQDFSQLGQFVHVNSLHTKLEIEHVADEIRIDQQAR